MRKNKSIVRLVVVCFIAVLLIFIFLFRGWLKYEVKSIVNKSSNKNVVCKNCDSYFNDGVATHQTAYLKEGIKPQKELSDLDNLERRGVLVKLITNNDYSIRKMDHSRPLVLPKVSSFLNDLTKEYKQQLKDLKYVPFEITSATRSKRTVRQLIGNNVNAITNSAHLKGKTIDISYLKFSSNTEQLNCFIKAVKNLQDQNRCFVKFERAQGCLHITVR